jgi:tripartite-type tricarboxylate transporter receptor subunit TctC
MMVLVQRLGLIALTCLFVVCQARSEETLIFPTHTVRMIVPFAAGGPADVIARLLAQPLNQSLGKPFVVENHPGAGGNLGIGLVAQAAPDGHTVLVVTSSLVVNPSLYAKVPYDIYNDLAPVTLAAVSSIVLVAHPSLQVNSVKELVERMKGGGKGAIASPGTGTTGHLAAETFKRALNLDLVHVPFNGAAPTLTAVLAGHVPLALVAAPSAAPHLKQGTLRALAVTSEKRTAVLADVPTMAEAGVPGDQVSEVMVGILVQGRTPRATVDTLQRQIARLMAQPDIKQKLDDMGFEVVADTPDQFAGRIKIEVPKWAKVIRDAKIEMQ